MYNRTMRRVWLGVVPGWILVVVLGLIVLHAPITVYVSSHWPSFGLEVKAWKEILMLVAGGLLAADLIINRRWRLLKKQKLLGLAAVFIVINLVALFWTHNSFDGVVAGLAIDLRYVIYFSLVYWFLTVHPEFRRRFLAAGAIGAVIVIGFACLQLLLPRDFLTVLGYGDSTIAPYITVDKNPDFVRQNSTLRGPNPLGAYALVVISVLVAFGLRKFRAHKWNAAWLVALLASSVALWVSYSRSALFGMLLAVLIIVSVVRVGSRRFNDLPRFLVLGAVIATIIGYFMWNTNFTQNVILHNNPTTGASIDSNQGHVESLVGGVSRVLTQPFGAGIGSTGSASLLSDQPLIIENQYLFVAHESGWLGLAVFGVLVVAVLIQLWRRRSDWLALGFFAGGIGLLFIGLLLPVWVDDTVSLVWWGIAAVIISNKGGVYAGSANQKAKRTA